MSKSRPLGESKKNKNLSPVSGVLAKDMLDENFSEPIEANSLIEINKSPATTTPKSIFNICQFTRNLATICFIFIFFRAKRCYCSFTVDFKS